MNFIVSNNFTHGVITVAHPTNSCEYFVTSYNCHNWYINISHLILWQHHTNTHSVMDSGAFVVGYFDQLVYGLAFVVQTSKRAKYLVVESGTDSRKTTEQGWPRLIERLRWCARSIKSLHRSWPLSVSAIPAPPSHTTTCPNPLPALLPKTPTNRSFG